MAPSVQPFRWAKSTVLRILKNEMYAGVWHYNKFQGCEPRNPASGRVYRRRRKCSVRQRPKSEWIPLTLPESLQLVPRDRWQRVQEQIARNLAFSPRNEKHIYLLKGLVNCGACGNRYVGDPCHGKFYYRCIARCKRMPSVKEGTLEEAVKQAVRRVLLNPDVILAPLRRLGEAEAREQVSRQKANRSAQAELKRLGIEEERILDAYRTGVISPAQLGQQLEAIRARRGAITVQRSESQTENPSSEQARKAVSDYCAEAANNLAEFTPEQWRQLLQTVIRDISFQGNQFTVHGRIPVGSIESGVEFTSPQVSLSDGLRPQ